ncbi:unnamed protein product [Orchesella dallaii]|uniref:Uncharacterized protein n=1 Tax=Orchesella dallaii TaxID=48710 RepID=A0ABP1QCT7_9HEXA
MQLSHLILLLVLSIVLVLLLHVDCTESTYAYTIRGFVQDVRHQPLRFIGGLFFKKAFILKKLKLKWKLKKKFVLKKLLKKLFLGWKLAGLKLSTKAILPQIFAQHGRHKEPYYWGWGGWSQIPPSFYHHHHYPPHLQFKLHHGLSIGRKRRAIRFPEDNGGGSGSSSSGSSSSSSSGFNTNPALSHFQREHELEHSVSSSSGRMFFDEEFQSIGLGQQELDMLKQLPENLQYEYKQEMQDLETSASEPKEEHIMEYLTVTNEFDTDHCIAKGICEVMAKGNRTDNRFENLLLDYYNEEPESRKDPNGQAAYIYDYAAFLGKSRGDSRACASYFPKCPEERQSLSTFMNEIFSSEMCDPPPVTNQLF